MLAFLSSLVREQNDTLVIKASVASNEPTKTLIELAVAASIVRTLSVLVRLPEAIKEVENQLEGLKQAKARMSGATESGSL